MMYPPVHVRARFFNLLCNILFETCYRDWCVKIVWHGKFWNVIAVHYYGRLGYLVAG